MPADMWSIFFDAWIKEGRQLPSLAGNEEAASKVLARLKSQKLKPILGVGFKFHDLGGVRSKLLAPGRRGFHEREAGAGD